MPCAHWAHLGTLKEQKCLGQSVVVKYHFTKNSEEPCWRTLITLPGEGGARKIKFGAEGSARNFCRPTPPVGNWIMNG